MRDRPSENPGNQLPPCVTEFIGQIARKIRYRRKVRQDVQAELTAHFDDELRDCADGSEREQRAQRLIEDFGDAKLLAVLCRRAKKRCRPLWVRAWGRTKQAVGMFLLVFVPYTIWFVRGVPNPTIDYLPQLNALSHSSGETKDDAWPYYERAMRLVVEPNEMVQKASWFKYLAPPKEPLTAQERKVLDDWIAANPLAWLQFEFATARTQCRRVYRRVRGTLHLLDVIDKPPPVKLRRLAQLGLWKSRLAAGIEDLGKTVRGVEMYRYALVYTLLPAERRVSELTFQKRAEYEALVTVVAAMRYRLEKGSYPPNLGALVREGYLAKTPMDPYSDAPLVYRRTNDDFILYSVGPDFTDDGGEPGRDKEGQPKPWGDKGDMVFWPVGP